MLVVHCWIFFFFNDTATTEIYTLSLHDALPILNPRQKQRYSMLQASLLQTLDLRELKGGDFAFGALLTDLQRLVTNRMKDRKSTRLNSSHANISYAVFCLKKKKKNKVTNTTLST